jgi:hypothetical protein
MDLVEFTQGAGGSGMRWFVANVENYLDKGTFLKACWNESKTMQLQGARLTESFMNKNPSTNLNSG